MNMSDPGARPGCLASDRHREQTAFACGVAGSDRELADDKSRKTVHHCLVPGDRRRDRGDQHRDPSRDVSARDNE